MSNICKVRVGLVFLGYFLGLDPLINYLCVPGLMQMYAQIAAISSCTLAVLIILFKSKIEKEFHNE